MNNRITLGIICPLVAIFFYSCSMLPAATPELEYREISLLPGECLMNNELTCLYCNPDPEAHYQFLFAINLDIEYEVIEYAHFFTTSYPKVHRHIPSDSVFKKFGGNSTKVKEEYDNVWNGIGNFSQSTFFYKDDIILTADKEFAGVPAGENLAGLIIKHYKSGAKGITSYIPPFDIENEEMVFLKTLSYYYVYGPENDMTAIWNNEGVERHEFQKQAMLSFAIPAEGCTYTREDITFTLSIPVRCAQYLTWLNDKLSDENAQMTWKDEVLTCTFQAHKVLKKKSE